MPAGDSAAAEARRQLALADAHVAAATEARATAARYGIADVTEKETATALVPLAAVGHHLLADRRWPGSRRAQVDLVVVGPGGVFIVDTKAWKDVSIHADRIHRGQEDVTDDVLALADLAYMSALRLFDLERDVVHTVAHDGDFNAVTTGKDYITLERVADKRLQVVYAAPPESTESLGLFIPGGPYIADVPVVHGDVPGPDLPGTPSAEDDATDPLDLGPATVAPVFPLESYTRELEGAVQTLTSTDEVRVTLGSDVLFAVDSADLTPDAQVALDVAAEHLSSREPGTVRVVGHTDDVMDDAYNQALSERRADAVAAALADRIDTGRFEIQARGRGKREPLVGKTDDASRAMNRRVELTLISQITETVDLTTAGELPEIDGAVGTGADGVQVDSGAGATYHVRAPAARRIDGHLVVDLEVTPVNEEGEAGVHFLDAVWHYRGSVFTVQRSAAGSARGRSGSRTSPCAEQSWD